MNNTMNAASAEMIPLNNQVPQVFDSMEFGSLEVVMIDGKPHFPATDCAKILGYSNPRDAISKHCKRDGVAKCDGVSKTVNQHGTETIQKVQRTYITEGNLYRLIIRSKLPAAERFERWVFDDVLPTIRETGSYGGYINQIDPIKFFEEPKHVMLLARSYNKLYEEKVELEAKMEADKPKVDFADSLLETETCIPASDLAKIIHQNGVDVGQHRLYFWMRENGYLMKEGDSRNLPTQKAMRMGLFKISEKKWFNRSTLRYEISRKTLVTPRGQMYFINLFINGKANYDGRC